MKDGNFRMCENTGRSQYENNKTIFPDNEKLCCDAEWIDWLIEIVIIESVPTTEEGTDELLPQLFISTAQKSGELFELYSPYEIDEKNFRLNMPDPIDKSKMKNIVLSYCKMFNWYGSKWLL